MEGGDAGEHARAERGRCLRGEYFGRVCLFGPRCGGYMALFWPFQNGSVIDNPDSIDAI